VALRRKDLSLLVSLDVLLEERNVTRAASRLHLSQSTVSGHLAQLRDLFGDALLVPSQSGRGMVATPRALEIGQRLHGMLSELQSAMAESIPFDPATSERTFTVAINDNAFSIVGLPVAADLLGMNAHGLRMRCVAPDMANLLERMQRGEIDLFVGAARTLPESLRQRPLIRDRFVMAQRKRHPRGRAAPTLAAYCALEHVLVAPGGGFHSPIDDRLAELGRSRRVVLSVAGYNQVALLLAASDAVATLPERLLARFADKLDTFELPFEMESFELSMGWLPQTHEDPAHQWLRQRFAEAAGD